MAATYLDSSAIVKLVVLEPESSALRRYLLRRRPLVSSALARTEVLRALMPAGEDAVAAGRKALSTFDLVRINDRILRAAGVMVPTELRSLDAIHLAIADRLGDEISTVVTYDDRMADIAREQGHRVVAPH